MLILHIIHPSNLLLLLLPHLVKVQLLVTGNLERGRGRTRRRIIKGEILRPLLMRMGERKLQHLPIRLGERNLWTLLMRLGASKLQPFLVRLVSSNLPLLVKLVVTILLRNLRRQDTNIGPLARYVRETTVLIYALEFQRCRECGPSLKEIQLLSHPYLLSIPCHQPLLVMLETSHQPMTTRLKARKEESSPLAIYAWEVTLLTFVLV